MIEHEQDLERNPAVKELFGQLAHLRKLKDQGINVCSLSKDITRKIRGRLGLTETPDLER